MYDALLQETFGSGRAAQSEAGKKGGQIAKERGEWGRSEAWAQLHTDVPALSLLCI